MGKIIVKTVVRKKYLHDYDDPYKILATTLISKYDGLTIRRILHEDTFVVALIRKEVRQQDIKGDFSDCIVQCILEDKRRMQLMNELDGLAWFFFNNLDLERLRGEIRNFCEDCWD